MKFGEKYELLESLTTGGVETFVANDKVRGERVLVHILECEAQKPSQPTVQWVLEAFRRIAPEPAALVLETGRYSGTLYGYLVTKMPDEAALTKWVQLYKAQGRETQDIPVPLAKATPESEAPTADMSAKARPPMPAGVTPPGFKDLSAANLGNRSVPTKEPDYFAQALPQGKPSGDRSEIRPAPDWNTVNPGIAAQGKPGPNRNSPDSFSSAFDPRNFPSEANPPSVRDSPGPGEFTKFFQGPFRVEGSAETPAVSAQQVEPPRKGVGEFTAMFNAPVREDPLPEAGVAGNESPGSGFTGFFNNPNLASRTSGTAGAPPASVSSRPAFDESPPFPALPKEPFVPPQPIPYVASTPVVSVPPVLPLPPFPNPVIEKPPAMPHAGPASEGATNAFNRRPSEAPSSPPAPPGAPSPYTQVISVRRAAEPTVSEKQAVPNSAGGFPAPSMPSVPAIAPPPMPVAPAMPKMAAPPAPKAAKGAIPQPTVSYWPLILTLTVLFFIAVLLVLYFALKH